MKLKKFFVQVNVAGYMAYPQLFSSRNAAIRSYKDALNWYLPSELVTNCKGG